MAEPNTCACGHRRRDHRIEGAPGAPLEDVRWYECEVCDCEQFDGPVDLCGVVIGQERFVGAGLFKTCQNPKPCPDHSDGEA